MIEKIKAKVGPKLGIIHGVFVYTSRMNGGGGGAQKTYFPAFQGVITTMFSTAVS